MEISFDSKLYTDRRRKLSALEIIISIVAMAILLCAMIKCMMHDLSKSDIAPAIISFLIILRSRKGGKEGNSAPAEGKFTFDENSINLEYSEVYDPKKKDSFVENVSINAKEIAYVQYVEDSGYIKISGKFSRIRKYKETGKIRNLSRNKKSGWFLINISDHSSAQNILEAFDGYDNLKVWGMDEETEDEIDNKIDEVV